MAATRFTVVVGHRDHRRLTGSGHGPPRRPRDHGGRRQYTGRGGCTRSPTTPPVPVVTGISPTSAALAGGTIVTITGTGFTGATKVDFGAVAATSFTVVSDTEITAVSPAQAVGTHDVLVTTPGGTS